MADQATLGTTTPADRFDRLTRTLPPRKWHVRPADVIAVIAFNAILIIGMWIRHGALGHLRGPSEYLTAAGQITALLGTYGVLLQIMLMTRSPFLEQLFGMDRLSHWHRLLGYAVTYLILGHVLFTTAGYAMGDRSSLWKETKVLLTRYPDVMMAAVGTVLLAMVAVTSVRIARRKLKYETWHLIHLYAYAAIALSFAHQLAVGTDFSNDALARGYWIGLYVIVGLTIFAFRVGHPLLLSLRHRLRVLKVVPEAPGISSIYITGRNLDHLRASSGQFFKWRFLAGKDGWPAHPFSLSASPNSSWLRITVKDVGDRTAFIQRLRRGTKVAIEGPYGIFTADRAKRSRALLIAGGIGIAPIRSLLEEMTRKNAPILLYRSTSKQELVFAAELDELVKQRGGSVHYLTGSRSAFANDPLSARSMLELVPDVRKRDVFVCGPAGMMESLHDSLNEIGVPDRQIHYERFAFL
ncbi:MAG: ferredoxin reductase family protein [Actinomycetota bacterium]